MSCERLKNILTELKVLIDNKNATNQTYKDFYQKWGIPYKSNLEKKITDTCANWNVITGTNIIQIDPQCVEDTKKLCRSASKSLRLPIFKDFNHDTWDERRWPADYRECYWEFAPYANNITQMNDARVQQECRVNTILGDPELTNNQELAASVAMILAKRIINCDPAAKNEFYDSFSSSEKINAFNTCVNSVVSEQQNYLRGCRLANKVQKNVNDVVQNCLIKTSFDRPQPTQRPTQQPTQRPTQQPTQQPTQKPTPTQTQTPTQTPTPTPTQTPKPTENRNFMIENTIKFVVGNIALIFLMFVIKIIFIR